MTQEPTDIAKSTSSGGNWWRHGVVAVLLLGAVVVWLAQRRWGGAAEAGAPIAYDIRLPADLPRTDRLELAPGSLRDWNVLLVTLDTTRADHLGCYGNREARTPVLDGLARRGAVFSDALAVAPSTLPSHASILTGLYPVHHRARVNGSRPLGTELVTLAELLGDAGYRTGAVVSSFVLDSQFGLDQGFEFYEDRMPESVGASVAPRGWNIPTESVQRKGWETNVHAMRWLRQRAAADERYFLWVHYFDPHHPYAPPEPFRSQVPRHLYDGEVAYMDEQLGELLDMLERTGLRDRTLVVVMGDHGEGLGQHQEMNHGAMVYESTMRVPLIFCAPGKIVRPAVVTCVASQVDVVPTILDLLGLVYQSDNGTRTEIAAVEGLDGRSLRTAPPTRGSIAYLETLSSKAWFGWSPLLAVRTERYKYVFAPHEELYDLRDDPHERRNLFGSRPEQAAALRRRLEAFFGADLLAATTLAGGLVTDVDAVGKLRALGYVDTGTDLAGVPRDLPDPKEMMPAHRRVLNVMTDLHQDGDLARAITRLEKIADEHERNYFARERLGELYLQAQRPDAALQQFEKVLAARPESAGCHLPVARLQFRLGHPLEAVKRYQQAVALNSENFEAQFELAEVLGQLGRVTDGIEHARHAVALAPEHVGAALLYCRLLDEDERWSEAVEFLRRSLDQRPASGPMRAELARILARQNDFAQAIDVLRKGLELKPDGIVLATNLAGLLSTCPDLSLRNRDEAVHTANLACDLEGRQSYRTLINLANVYAAFGENAAAAAAMREAAKAVEGRLSPQVVQQMEDQARQFESGAAQPDARPTNGTGPASEPEPAMPSGAPAQEKNG